MCVLLQISFAIIVQNILRSLNNTLSNRKNKKGARFLKHGVQCMRCMCRTEGQQERHWMRSVTVAVHQRERQHNMCQLCRPLAVHSCHSSDHTATCSRFAMQYFLFTCSLKFYSFKMLILLVLVSTSLMASVGSQKQQKGIREYIDCIVKPSLL